MFSFVRYSRWDNTQAQEIPGSDDLLQALSDDLLYHGDISRALRQLMQRGLSLPSGKRLDGIQDMVRRLRERQQETLSQHNLDSLYQDLKDRLDRVVQREKESIERRLQDMDNQGAQEPPEAQALQDAFRRMAQKNLDALEALPEDLPGAIQQLSDYEFLDPEAGREFQELLQMLQKSVLDSFFQDLTQRLEQLTPEELEQIRDMTRALNQMLEQKRKGQRPDFDGFMQQFGHMFGPNPPQTLEELIERLQQQMSQTQSLLNSLSSEQQESLLDLLSSQLFDSGLQDELAELAANLDLISPSGISGQEYRFFGDESTTLTEAMRLMKQLQELEQLERQLDRTRFGADLEDVDQDLMEQLLGKEAADNLEELKRLTKLLEEAGYVEREGDELKLTALGTRKIGQKDLPDIF